MKRKLLYALAPWIFIVGGPISFKEPAVNAQQKTPQNVLTPREEQVLEKNKVVTESFEQAVIETATQPEPKKSPPPKPKIKLKVVTPEKVPVYYKYDGYVVEGTIEKCGEGYFIINLDSVIRDIVIKSYHIEKGKGRKKNGEEDTILNREYENEHPVKKNLWRRIFRY